MDCENRFRRLTSRGSPGSRRAGCRFSAFTNPKRQRGKQVTSALPREVFASLALRVSIFLRWFRCR